MLFHVKVVTKCIAKYNPISEKDFIFFILRNLKFYLLKNRKKRRVMFLQAILINLFSTILYKLATITLTLNDYYIIKENFCQILIIFICIGIFSYLNKAILINRMAILLGLGANLNFSLLQDLYNYLF